MRACISVGASSSPICSATRQPKGTFSLLWSPRLGLRLVQKRDHHDFRTRFVDVHLQCVADVRSKPVGIAGVDQVLSRSDHDLAKPGQLAHQVGSLLDDFLPAHRLDHRPAGNLERDRKPVAADQTLAVVDDRVRSLFEIERSVDLVREPLKLVPQPLLRHHLPHLAVLQIGCRQVAEVADEPERALLLRRPPGGIHQDLEQAHDLLVHHERGDDQNEVGGIECLRNAFDHGARRNVLGLRRLEHAAQKGVVRGGLDPAVHHPGYGKFDLILKPEPATAVHHPERTAARGHRRDRPVQKLNVKLVRLNVRFRQVGDLSHQLPDLILRLLEQTRIDNFFRHGGTSGLSPGSVVASPRQAFSSLAFFRRPAADRNRKHAPPATQTQRDAPIRRLPDHFFGRNR